MDLINKYSGFIDFHYICLFLSGLKVGSRDFDLAFLKSLLTVFPGTPLPLFSVESMFPVSHVFLLLDLLPQFSGPHLPMVFWQAGGGSGGVGNGSYV